MAVVLPEGYDELINAYYRKKVAVKKKTKDRNLAFVESVVGNIMGYIGTVDDRFDTVATRYGEFCELGPKYGDHFQYSVKLLLPAPVKYVRTPNVPDASGNYRARTYGFDRQPRADIDVQGRPLGNGEPMTRIHRSLGVTETGLALTGPPYRHGYMETTLDDPEWDDLVRQGDVIPFLVKQRFQKLLHRARVHLDLEDSMSIEKKVTGWHFTMTFYRGGHDLVVDLAVVAETQMKMPAWVIWPRTTWPPAHTVAAVREAGISLVPSDNFYWRESYAQTWNTLIEGIDNDGGQRQKVLCILKELNKDIWSPDLPLAITQLEIKNMWLWALEYNPEPENWKQDHVVARVIEVFYMLQSAVTTGNMTHYFDSRVNLFKAKDQRSLKRTKRNMADFLQNMPKYLAVK